jgi:hypothetical protein
VLHDGFLSMKPVNGKGLSKKRFFVLKDTTLSFFSDNKKSDKKGFLHFCFRSRVALTQKAKLT